MITKDEFLKQCADMYDSSSDTIYLHEKLCKSDFRTDEEKQLDNFIIEFGTGCEKVIEYTDPYQSRPQILRKTESVFAEICMVFMKSHFKKVQQPFWEKYKHIIEPLKIHTSITYTDGAGIQHVLKKAIPAKDIYNKIKSIKSIDNINK